MNRREFLTRVKQKPVAKMVASGLIPYSGDWTYNEAAHLLKRTMFGAKKQDVDYFLSLSVNDAVDELINNTRTVSPPLRDYGPVPDINNTVVDDPTIAMGQTWVNDLNIAIPNPLTRSQINRVRIESLRKWWAGLIVNQQRTIEEKMVLFWHHHFSVQREEVNNANYLYTHHDLLRRNALGNVRELTKLVTIDAAMLVHLNGYLNSKRAPDENYARELQELFTVGKGDDSLYTEGDVREAARVLTGWRINPDTLVPYCDSNSHDTGSKTFSAFYNNTTISGNSDGMTEIDQFINMIFATAECSKYICRKLYKWFVYYEIDNDTEINVIAPLAEIFRNNNFEVKPVLKALLASEHFFDKKNQSCHIKSPYDFMVGTLREFNVSFPDYSDVSGYPLFYSLFTKAAEMQQELFQPPDVSGWPSYHQEPMYYEVWVNSNSLPRRATFTDELADQNIIDTQTYIAQTSDPSNQDIVINEVCNMLLRYPLSENSKTYIKTNILTDTSADNKRAMIKFLMNLPEYHLC
jgi:uncharacterized protein (DUF1800 family)